MRLILLQLMGDKSINLFVEGKEVIVVGDTHLIHMEVLGRMFLMTPHGKKRFHSMIQIIYIHGDVVVIMVLVVVKVDSMYLMKTLGM